MTASARPDSSPILLRSSLTNAKVSIAYSFFEIVYVSVNIYIADIDKCKDLCDEKTQRCIMYGKAPMCICKEEYVPGADGKCIKNPCLKDNGGCGESAMCFPHPKTGEAKCNCASGKMLDEKKNCVNEDPCKCGVSQPSHFIGAHTSNGVNNISFIPDKSPLPLRRVR